MRNNKHIAFESYLADVLPSNIHFLNSFIIIFLEYKSQIDNSSIAEGYNKINQINTPFKMKLLQKNKDVKNFNKFSYIYYDKTDNRSKVRNRIYI